MYSDDSLRRALDALADADRSRGARPHVERAVLDAFARRSRRARLARVLHSSGVGRAAAAVLVVGLSAATYVYTRRVEPSLPSHGITASPAIEEPPHAALTAPPPEEMEMGRAAQSLPADGDVGVFQTARIRVPRAYLPMLGVPILEPDAEGVVDIEVLLGEDGQRRALRVIY